MRDHCWANQITAWVWGNAQQEAFRRLQVILTSDCVVAHYNQATETELKVDASPVGLGAILLQQCSDCVHPVAYASRTLTDVERRHSQTEKEALAVVWACKHFHIYLYDACTCWPEVVLLRSTTSAAIIGHLRKIFAVHGLPEKVVTDNGANLVSEEFEVYLATHGIQHRKVTPYWPQVNARVEQFKKTIEKAIRTAHAEGKDWRTDMFAFLLNYRAAPHATTGASPAFLHLGREIRTKVPQVETQLLNAVPAAIQSAKGKDQQAKQHTKVYADKRNRASPSDIKSGDKVLLQQAWQNKLSTLYDPQPYTVLERKGPSLILQQRNGRVFMHNVSHIHKLHQITAVREEDDYGMDFDLPKAMNPPRAAEQDMRGSAHVRRVLTHLRDYQLH
ncbi:Uncharacterized protein K02A2.6 [Stylophora pistillata]|uniref:Uncharacterized protein K02A2.6 n=1 Tax=Stylophora pistillata TaxID=50429 RepID=A0A2B4SZV1_STYPI|nr:Uncharacterized protein K02A2.6 [Stylophora pistillata]